MVFRIWRGTLNFSSCVVISTDINNNNNNNNNNNKYETYIAHIQYEYFHIRITYD